MSTATAFTVTLPADGDLGQRNYFGEPILAVEVKWSAFVGARGLVVSVTAVAASFQNKTWVDPRHFVADGLDASPPPAWVPAPPEWFWRAVDDIGA